MFPNPKCSASDTMRAVAAFVLVAVLSLGVAQETTSKNAFEDQLNIIETKPSARLDPYIRKALLKALSDLEESVTITEFDAGDSTSDVTNTEQQPTETNKENIKIHSFIVNGQEAFTQTSNTSPLVFDKNISILSTTAGNVENYVSSGTLPTQDPFPEILQTRESTSNLQQVRSIQGTSKSTSTGKNNHKFSNFKPFRTSTTTTSTTTTTTTTTTPKPTHNSDGENIEEVDKRDVQVYQAPLLAAFTVQQDEHGIPKNVIPIYQQSNNNQDLKLASSSISTSLDKGQNDYISLQLSLQRELEEKQRILEDQLRLLQFHQRQQEQILRQQQLLIQQKEAQRQQQLYLEQERLNRLLLEQQKLNSISNNVQSNLPNKQSPPAPAPINAPFQLSPQVYIQKSVALDQSNIIPNQQQLPNREAVDFLFHLRNQQQNQFPLQENHLPQGIDNFLRPKPKVGAFFNQGVNNNQLSTIDDLSLRQGNRVFRQESGVGNFGVNYQNTNRFNTFPAANNNNRYFPINRPNQFNSDFELKQLLAQRGLNGRAQEDLNIVSKVLSLNHGIPISNFSNRPFDGRRQRIL